LAAWEFIKILLSDEIQNSSLTYSASPVISELSRDGVIQHSYGSLTMLNDDKQRAEIASYGAGLTDEDIKAYNAARYDYYDNINRLVFGPEGPLNEIIVNNAVEYYKSDAGLDECIANMKAELAELED
jgi:beta-galactosidase GanA